VWKQWYWLQEDHKIFGWRDI